jgi:(E)-4-hydroxy-3-methylbut-2-enyl-diphosphate synthase
MDYRKIRRETRQVCVGNVRIGGDAPIAIQSMTNTDTRDAAATMAQIRALEAAGCDVVRLTVPDLEAAETVRLIKESDIRVPIVADIHFQYRVALRCAEYGVDKIRINPGNIGDEERVRQVAQACRSRNIPIRIGVNSGSLEKHILEKCGAPTPEALCESGLYHARLLEKYDFEDIVISIKSSDVYTMVAATKLLASSCNYPLHLGVTEAGSQRMGTVKSAAGIGALLCDGIGDTIRVSLTDDPVLEVSAARDILSALNIKGQSGLNIVSCPTCGRTKIDLISLVHRFEDAVASEGLGNIPCKVALMGCVVNGPGEASRADFGIAGGKGEGILFRKGEILRKVPMAELVDALMALIEENK